jgi:GDP-D-mannose dehydratase
LEVATFLQREIAPDVTFALDERQLRPVEIPVMRGSFNKLHETTGWEPSITLETSLRDVIAEHRSKK